MEYVLFPLIDLSRIDVTICKIYDSKIYIYIYIFIYINIYMYIVLVLLWTYIYILKSFLIRKPFNILLPVESQNIPIFTLSICVPYTHIHTHIYIYIYIYIY